MMDSSPPRTPPVVFPGIIRKSDNDKCDYRHITLANGLQALLIHYGQLEKAAIALNVGIGYLCDPREERGGDTYKPAIPGLAHFLEHMLFLGSDKYPEANEYQRFLTENGGNSNAYTSAEETNFYLNVSSDKLELAMDRLSRFFIKPQFDKNFMDLEMNAVDSENKKNLLNDGRRIFQTFNTLIRHDHPFHAFSTGNLETLRDVPAKYSIDMRQTVMDFYDKHYSANLMKLVVYGKEPLNQLAAMVEEKFADVPFDLSKTRPEWPPMPLAQTKKLLTIKTIKETRNLTVKWQIPDQQMYKDTKPGSFCAHLIGHECEHGLAAYLKEKAWIMSMNAGIDSDYQGFGFFSASFVLSHAGCLHIDEIIHALFAYIHMTRRNHAKFAELYSDFQKISSTMFRFKSMPGSSSTYAYTLASGMQSTAIEHILDESFHVDPTFNEAVVLQFLENLDTENFNIILARSDVVLTDPRTEYWYKTEYSVEDVSPALLSSLANATLPEYNLELPQKNDLIPTDFSLKPIEAATVLPVVIDSREFKTELTRSLKPAVWYKKDEVFLTPKANIRILFQSPHAYSSPKAVVCGALFTSLVMDSLSGLDYQASNAGLSFSVSFATEGITVYVSGFNHKICNLLLEVIRRTIVLFKASPSRFTVFKDNLLQHLRNRKDEAPYIQSVSYLNQVIQSQVWTTEDKLAAAEATTLDDVCNLGLQVFADSRIVSLFHGNLTKAEVIRVVDSIMEIVKPNDIHKAVLVPTRRVMLDDSSAFIYSPPAVRDVNSAIALYMQTGKTSNMRDRVLSMLLVQILNEPFYTQLRTNEQLGYVVSNQNRESMGACAVGFIVQSLLSPPKLQARIEKFIAESAELVQALDSAQLKSYINALITNLLIKKKNIGEETAAHWDQIYMDYLDFDRKKNDAECLQSFIASERAINAAKTELLEFMREVLLPEAPRRRQLAIHIWSEKNEEKPDENQDPPAGNTVITDLLGFKAQSALYPAIPPLAKSWTIFSA